MISFIWLQNVSTEIPYEHIEESTKIEEADVEKPVDSLQVKPEDIKQHDSNLDINNPIEEQIQDTDSREISSDNAEREPVDAGDTNEEILEAKVNNILNLSSLTYFPHK